MGLKWTEILLILFALMLLFGTTRLPQLGKSLGSAIRNFKKGFSGEEPDEAVGPDGKKLPETGTVQTATTAGEKAASKS